MKQDNGAVGKLRLPKTKIPKHVVVSMPPVNVQEINASIAEVVQCLVESHPHQARECAVMRIHRIDRLPDVVPIEAGMFVTLPGVDRITLRRSAMTDDCLAHCKIGKAVMRPKLDQPSRA